MPATNVTSVPILVAQVSYLDRCATILDCSRIAIGVKVAKCACVDKQTWHHVKLAWGKIQPSFKDVLAVTSYILGPNHRIRLSLFPLVKVIDRYLFNRNLPVHET